MSFLLPLCLIISSMITSSNAAYCVCKEGNEQVLQRAIDYACGAGADCTQIQQNGACFQPNTVKNHCDVAVNSYYQKKASSGATCDFNGAATISTSPPSSGTPSTGTPSTGTPSTGTPSTGTPSTGTPSTGTPSTGTPTTGTPTTGTPPSGTPSTGTPTTGTPTSGGFPSTGTPTSGSPTSGMPNSGTPSNGMPSSSSSSVFPGTTFGPTGSGDPNAAGETLSVRTNIMVFLVTGAAMVAMMV
ncbi:unnamed protein product [Cochlearia groenlandica]